MNFISKGNFVNGGGTNIPQDRLWNSPGVGAMQIHFSTLRGYNFSIRKRFNQIYGERSGFMFVVAVVICLLLFAALASADLLVSDINSDELSNMGVEKKS
jgi:hypothetical protein